MAKTGLKCILLINILVSLTQAALINSQNQQYSNNQPHQQQSYVQNSLDEPRFPSRSSALKEKTQVEYDHVDDLGNRVLDSFDHRYPDGSYEYRYELADGQARYERGYFIRINKKKSLVVVGYYSYRMPDGKFITVFYNADIHGYRQNQSITRDTVPDLPRSIEVPQLRDDGSDDAITSSTTSKSNYNNAYSTTTRNNF